MERILARVRDYKTDDPLDPTNALGALVDGEHCTKVASYLGGEAPLAAPWTAFLRPPSTVDKMTRAWKSSTCSV